MSYSAYNFFAGNLRLIMENIKLETYFANEVIYEQDIPVLS